MAKDMHSRAITKDNVDLMKEKLIEFLVRTNFNVTQACKALSISRQAFYDMKNEDENFRNKVHEAQLEVAEKKMIMLEETEAALRQNVKERKEQTCIFLAKVLDKETYSEKTQVELSTAQDMSFNIVAASKVKIESEIEEDDEQWTASKNS